MIQHRRLTVAFSLVAILVTTIEAQDQKPQSPADKKDAIPTIAEKTKEMERHDGFLPFYWDANTGKIWLEIQHFDQELLYVHSLATGLGSNPVGLDRGKLGSQKVVRFLRIGPRILMLQRNLRFRARTDRESERMAVQQSFAQSVIWGGNVAAEQDGKVLVDFTEHLMSDIQGVTGTLARTGQGDFSVDTKRSAIYLPRCKGFPDNTELESSLTFQGKRPGNYVRETAPTPTSITLRQHHSFVRLPDDEYRPRAYDVRCPSMHITFADYAAPLDASLESRWILRHRLVKKNPAAALSEAVEPIVYYVDAGAPEQIQQALIEGASWWNQAFEAAGFKNAFQVRVMPEDADPMDVRYNVIQWVHRSTRGWSYGGSVIDPRTGEIIKGHVTLGSLRVRQDRLLFEGLGQIAASASAQAINRAADCGMAGVVGESALVITANQSPVDVALARIRQLSAHEVGHTLGFVHNFAASTYDDRASVMDYPAPRIGINDEGQLDFSDAYGVGIGSWDKISVRYAYAQFPEGADESEELNKILAEAAEKKMLFISDSDSRPASASHPLSNLWDNGSNPLDELEHVLRVRQIALRNFDPKKLPSGTTTADIEQYLVPVYLHHRYQVQAVGKMVGGTYYQFGYAENPLPVQEVSIQDQRNAIRLLLSCLSYENLRLPDAVVQRISPQPQRSIRRGETFDKRTGRNFDRYEPARVAIDLVLDELLNVQRLNRFGASTQVLSLREFLADLAVGLYPIEVDADAASQVLTIRRLKKQAFADKLMELVDHPQADPSTAAAALAALEGCQKTTAIRFNGDIEAQRITRLVRNEQAFQDMLQRKIDRFLNRPYAVSPKIETPTIPPGSPIGSGK